MKRILFVLIGASLLLSCRKAEGPADPVDPTDPVTASDTLVLMSFNVRYPATEDTGTKSWNQRKGPAVKMILDVKPDLIGFQEPRPAQLKDIKEGVGEKYGFYDPIDGGAIDGNCGHTGIAYNKEKLELVDKGHFWLSDTPDKASTPKCWNAEDASYRTCCWLQLKDKANGRVFFFFCTHLPYKTADIVPRTNSAELCVKRMKNALMSVDLKTPMFMVGDMNCSHQSGDKKAVSLAPFYNWMKAARDSAPVTDQSITFNNYGSASKTDLSNQLDHIFYKNSTCLEFKVINANYGVPYVSDHYPVIARIKL